MVEERIEGEESSFHAFSDGRHFVPAPLTRDYKRALDWDKGRLTGGMGSYRGPEDRLPFLPPSEWDSVVRLEQSAFDRWKGRGSNPGLRGIVPYDALMHTRGGFKILERNSRGGNTEQMCLLTTMLDDYVDVCYRMVDGSLKGIRSRQGLRGDLRRPPELRDGQPARPCRRGREPGQCVRAPGEKGRHQGLPHGPEARRDRDDSDGRLAVRSGGGRGSVGRGRPRHLGGGGEALGRKFRFREDVGSEADIARSREHLQAVRKAGRDRKGL